MGHKAKYLPSRGVNCLVSKIGLDKIISSISSSSNFQQFSLGQKIQIIKEAKSPGLEMRCSEVNESVVLGW